MTDYIPNEQDHELDWDDVITKDSTDFTLLKDGKYPFTVKSFARAQYNGGPKLPACKMCELEIIVRDPSNGDEVLLKHRLYLHSRTEGLISQFFCSIGLKKHGEPLKMEWNKVPGATGICKVYIDTYKDKDDQDRQVNRIKNFCDPEPAAKPTQTPQSQPTQQTFGGFGAWN